MEFIWITGKRFWKSIFLHLIHAEIILKEFNLTMCKENVEQFRKLQGQGLFLQEMTNKNRGTFPMPTFAGTLFTGDDKQK